MRAVRIHEYGGPETLRYEDDVPDPAVGADTVLTEAFATSVNPIDWKIRSGARQKDFPLQLPAVAIWRSLDTNGHAALIRLYLERRFPRHHGRPACRRWFERPPGRCHR